MDRVRLATGVSLAILMMAGAGAGRMEGQTGCAGKPIACGQTVDATVGAGSCSDSKGNLFDAWSFEGVAGEEVAVTISSATAGVTVVSGIGNGEISGPDDFKVTTPVALGATEEGSTRFGATLGTTSANWFVMVAAATPGLKFLSSTAPYTLSLSCSGLTSCKAGLETLCLLDGRFQVQATYAASTGQAGQAQTVPVSDDTGFLWFYAPTNIETVVKVIDGCGLGGHYWFFAGGLTNSKVVLTVTDTKTNTTRRYTNPENAAFQPIQDTSAFATCP